MSIPKKIWSFWDVGEERAPAIVQTCLQSWRNKNSSWQVNILSRGSISECSKIKRLFEESSNLKIQALTDLLRLRLLRENGGIWVDATSMCVLPLDDWIDQAASSGFFAFQRPGRDREIASWFLASERKNAVTVEWIKQLEKVLLRRKFPLQGTLYSKAFHRAAKIALGQTPSIATAMISEPYLRMAGSYPYAAVHYSFSKALKANPAAKQVWDDARKISAVPSHIVQRANGYRGCSNEEIYKRIASERTPVLKLNWRREYQRDMLANLTEEVERERKKIDI
ncbi:hypothetical protein CVM52_13495 [Pseudooceanicola lipolyticus]|uniref:Mannosyltransferase n=1 Tax=Pseudooceanicola lipolyticus TaxID=2029104 RepID=A0A2M8J031_9RHOB|nr:capsular polysaccharide synthesis protein [Pseudooceanicola lipolyticus]PJE36153.1 hypothetical protein CVM52_13495 [Pseudooceanicola lipolyticus]